MGGGIEVGVVKVHNEGIHKELQGIRQIARPRGFSLVEEHAQPARKNQSAQERHIHGLTYEVQMDPCGDLEAGFHDEADGSEREEPAGKQGQRAFVEGAHAYFLSIFTVVSISLMISARLSTFIAHSKVKPTDREVA